jgi:hypothetical protein
MGGFLFSALDDCGLVPQRGSSHLVIDFGLMVQKFIEWWIRNAAYIGPLATTLAALAALLSVYMVTKTFRQARKDRQEEIEAKHPKFKISGAQLSRSGSMNYEMNLTIENTNSNAAYDVVIEGVFYHPEKENALCRFKREPVGHFNRLEYVHIEESLELPDSAFPYFFRLDVRCRDARTNKEYKKTHYRKVQLISGLLSNMVRLDQAELRSLSDSGERILSSV